jgi:outer membrane protein assembly factor BamB
MRTLITFLALAVALAAGLGAAERAGSAPAPFPASIALPTGFQPEGIAIRGQTFYVGSISSGAVFAGSLRTGQGAIRVPAAAGRSAIGVAIDNRNRLFVAGGATGHGYVYDARTGALLRDYTLTTDATFINDVVVTKEAVFFTDSVNQRLYKLSLGPGGSLPASSTPLPLTGDISFVAGFNVNGIDATPSGKTLIVVQTNTGFLFRVNPQTGVADRIELAGGALVQRGDGILLDGRTLFVVRNTDNLIAVIRLAPGLGSGSVVRTIASPPAPNNFDVPTTIDEHGNRLYAVNARFGVPMADRPTAAYSIVRVSKR